MKSRVVRNMIGKTKIKSGYVYVNAPSHKYSKPDKNGWILQHRQKVENFIGRRLKNGEVIHHIDSNKKNNEINNLMIFPSEKEHAEWHNKLKKFPCLTNPMKKQIAERWK